MAVPHDGVLIVLESEREPNKLVHMGMDYYFFEEGQVKSCQRADLDRYLRRLEGVRNIKFGRWASDKIWEQVHSEAMGV